MTSHRVSGSQPGCQSLPKRMKTKRFQQKRSPQLQLSPFTTLPIQKNKETYVSNSRCAKLRTLWQTPDVERELRPEHTHTEIQCCSPSPFVLNVNSPTVRHTLAVDAEKHCAVTLQLNRWAAGGASWQTRARRKTWHQIWTEVDRLDNSASWEKYSESSTV